MPQDARSPLDPHHCIAEIGFIQPVSAQGHTARFPGLIIAANIAVKNTAPGIDGYPGNVATFSPGRFMQH